MPVTMGAASARMKCSARARRGGMGERRLYDSNHPLGAGRRVALGFGGLQRFKAAAVADVASADSRSRARRLPGFWHRL